MEISVTQAEGRLTDLIRRAEAGEDAILTRDGRAAVRLAPLQSPSLRARLTPSERSAIIDPICKAAEAKITPGASGADLQDDLYDQDGLPA